MAQLIFIVANSTKDLAKSVGVPFSGAVFEPCPLSVGDVISYPSSPGLAFRVVDRWCRAGDATKPACWYLTVEQTPHPLESPRAA